MKKHGSGKLPSRSILSIANSIPGMFYVFFLPLFKVEDLTLGSVDNDRCARHDDRQASSTHKQTRSKRTINTRQKKGKSNDKGEVGERKTRGKKCNAKDKCL